MPKRSNHLREYCRRAGMTQADLARQLRVTPEWLSRIATGRAESTEFMEQQIKSILNLTDAEANRAFHFPDFIGHYGEEAGDARDSCNVIEFPTRKRNV